MLRWLFDRRRHERWACDIATTVRIADGTEIRVRITSLSDHGFRLKGSTGLGEETELVIVLPGYPAALGRVIWTKGDDCGGVFATPITVASIRPADVVI